MKTIIKEIAQRRMNAIATDKKLSIAPAANSELMQFLSENPGESVIEIMKLYVKEINKISYEIFRNTPVC